jgi:L-malate glycosyltransferase
MKIKKILIVSHEFPPRLGGAGRVAEHLGEYFIERDIDVTIITQKRKGVGNYGFKLIELPVLFKVWPISYGLYMLFSRMDQYDYIILNDSAAVYSAGLFMSGGNLKKTIIYVHGIEKYLEEKNIKLKIMLFKRFYKRAFNYTRKIIVVSRFLREKFFCDDLAEFKDKSIVIPNRIDSKVFYHDKLIVPKELREKDGIVTLLTVSRFVKEKGFDKKLEIFERLLIKDPNYIWIIVGEGNYRVAFEEKIKLRNLQEKIVMAGAVDRKELRAYYSYSKIFWLLTGYEYKSRYEWVETFGLVYLEAMACGCIPIAWNAHGPREVIKHGVNGFLAKTESEVIDIICNKTELINRSKMIDLAVRRDDPFEDVFDLINHTQLE